VLAQVALGGQSSVIRRMPLDPTLSGSLAAAAADGGWMGANDNTTQVASGAKATRPRFANATSLGSINANTATPSDHDDHDHCEAVEWAVVKALLVVKHGGSATVGYSWLVDAASEALASHKSNASTRGTSAHGAAMSALDRRARARAAVLSARGGPFGLEHVLCSASTAALAPAKVHEAAVRSPAVDERGDDDFDAASLPQATSCSEDIVAEEARGHRHEAPQSEGAKITRDAPTLVSASAGPRLPSLAPGVGRVKPSQAATSHRAMPIPPRIDKVTRQANTLRLILGAQVLRDRERADTSRP